MSEIILAELLEEQSKFIRQLIEELSQYRSVEREENRLKEMENRYGASNHVHTEGDC